jgi:NADH dehydrogenase FAD-containing subunit
MAIVSSDNVQCRHATLIDGIPDHLIGSPLALAESNYASKSWVKFEEVKALEHPAIKVVHGSVASVDLETMMATITPNSSLSTYHEPYDFLVAASGVRRVWPTVPQSLNRTNFLTEAQDHIDSVTAAREGVVVIGGGE